MKGPQGGFLSEEGKQKENKDGTMRKYIGMEKERTEGEEKERNGRKRKRDDRGERMSDRKNGTKTINLSAVEDTNGENEVRGKGEKSRKWVQGKGKREESQNNS